MGESVLIVGAGLGLSASIARTFRANGFDINLVSRNIHNIESLAKETKANLFTCDTRRIEQVKKLFDEYDSLGKSLDLVIYNPSARVRGPIDELDPEKTRDAIEISCFGAFLVAQQAAKRMLKQGFGSIFFTGASASVRGFPNSSVFAMGKFGLRGLAQALARELHPKNIHIGHFIIDGSIDADQSNEGHKKLNPDSIAKTYWHFYKQHRSSWSWEIELRPWIEKF